MTLITSDKRQPGGEHNHPFFSFVDQKQHDLMDTQQPENVPVQKVRNQTMLGNRTENMLAIEKNSEGKKMTERKTMWERKRLIGIYLQNKLNELKDRLEMNNLSHCDLYK